MAITFCSVEECVGLAKKDGLCWAHLKRKYRGRPLHEPLRARLGTWDAVADAIHAYADAPSDAAFKAAKERAQRAMRAWVRARDRARRALACPPGVGG